MAKIDRLDGGELADLKRRIRALEMASPLANASITRGRLRVASTEGLVVEGSAKVSGALNVTGVQNVDGTLNIDGLLLVDGATGINGALGINGDATVTGNMAVEGGGTITAGGMVIDPDVSGFGGIRSTGTIYLSAPGVVTTGQITGGSLLIVGGELSVISLPTTTNPPNLYVNGLGQFFRCV